MKCKYCGKEFETHDLRRKFCSADCYRLYYNEYRNNKAKRLYTENPELARVRDQKSNIANKARRAKLRREVMTIHANRIIMLAHKGNAEDLIADYLVQNFNARGK